MSHSQRLPPWVAWTLIALLALAVCSPLIDTAFFTLDDHRYLAGLRDIENGEPGAIWDSLVVENRWDQNWWIPDDTFVRFFRPFVIFAYGFDHWLWGMSPFGFVATNIMLHLVATLLVMLCCARLLGWGIGAWIAGLSFATHLAHFENLYYIAGRTTTIAAIALLAAIWLHLRTRDRPSPARQVAVAFLYFLALLGKESTALLPALLILLDLSVPPAGAARGIGAALRRNGVLVGACLAFGALYLTLRYLAVGPDSGSSPFPYLHLPDRDRFWTRTLAVWLQYSLSLSVGSFIHTFLTLPQQLYDRVSWLELSIGALWLPALCAYSWGDRRGRWFVAVLLLSLVPLLPLYSAARHIYIASFGYCALLGLAAHRLNASGTAMARAVLLLGIAVFVGVPAARLTLLLRDHPRELAYTDDGGRLQSPGSIYADLVTAGDLAPRTDRPLYLLDFPGGWYEMQFLTDALEVELDADMPAIHVLAPRLSNPRHHGRAVSVRRIDASTIELDRGGMTLTDPGGGGFDKRHLDRGDVVQRDGYRLDVLASWEGHPTRIRVRFDRPLDAIDLGQFAHGEQWRLKRVTP